MALKDEKQKIFGKIAALKTLNDGYPTFDLTNSFPSINNGKDGVVLLLDILKSLLGSEALQDIVSGFLVYKLDGVEVKVKNAVKNALKKMVNANTNPTVPDYLTNGFDVPIKDIDFFNQLQLDPQSAAGSSLYGDSTAGLNSTDFNTFLFETMQNPGTTYGWGAAILGQDILQLNFTENGTTNNLLNIGLSTFYGDKTLTDVNDSLIDTFKLFNSEKLVNILVEGIFGTITSVIDMGIDALLREEQINDVIQKFINADSTDIIDDSFFTFTKEEVRNQEDRATKRSKGIRVLDDCNNYESSIDYSTLSGVSETIRNASTKVEEKTAVDNALNILAGSASANASDVDKQTVNLDFIKTLIEELSKSLTRALLSPNMILLFVMNTNMFDDVEINLPEVNGPEINGPNLQVPANKALDFMKKIESIIKDIIAVIKDSVIEEILSVVIKAITKLAQAQKSEQLIEAAKNQILTLLSLIGIPQQVLEIIRGL